MSEKVALEMDSAADFVKVNGIMDRGTRWLLMSDGFDFVYSAPAPWEENVFGYRGRSRLLEEMRSLKTTGLILPTDRMFYDEQHTLPS